MKVGTAYLTARSEVTSDDFDLCVQASGSDRAITVLVLEDSALDAAVRRLEEWLQRRPDSPRLVVLLGSTGQHPPRALQDLQLR